MGRFYAPSRDKTFKSCQHALATLITDVHLAWYNNKVTCCCALDIKSAFDYVHPTILDNRLKKLKIPTKIRKFVFNLISNRNLYFKIGNKLVGLYTKSTGIPQGCVLSPLLYNIYVSEIHKIITNYHLIQYADDTLVYCAN